MLIGLKRTKAKCEPGLRITCVSMDVQPQPVVGGQLLAADVALELEEVDVAILPVLVEHRLRRESLVAEIARKNAKR